MNCTITRRREALALLCGACAAIAGLATAQPAATRAPRILCASPPGGTPDVIARHYAALLNGGALVDNRPGGSGFIAVAALSQAAPDGATMLLGHGGLLTLNPFLYAKLPYAAADLVSVVPAAETSFGFAVGSMVPESVRSIAAFADWSRANPGRAHFGAPLVGTLPHLLGLLLARDAGFALSHVPYQGGPQILGDLLGGRLAAAVLPDGLLRPTHDAGKLRVLATSGAQRSAMLPSVPTLAELGFARLVLSEWFGFFMPRDTPTALVESTAQTLSDAARSPTLVALLREASLRALVSTPAEMDQRIAREREFWRENAASTGVRL